MFFSSSRIPCTISIKSHQSCRDKIQNIYQIYKFLASNDETRLLLTRFRLWPLIFVPRSNDIGEFLFADQVFWEDCESLLTINSITDAESSEHIALRSYYGNDDFAKQFFTILFQVKQEPTLNDYLSLLNNIEDKKIDYIWKCIQVIIRLTFKENKQSIVKGIFKTIIIKQKNIYIRSI